MTKASKGPLRVNRSEEHLSVHMRDVLNRLENIAEFDGMSLVDIQHAVQLLLDNCGGSAKLRVRCDDYWGSGATLEWSRDETHLEMERRHSANAKRRATMKMKKPSAAKAKKDADLAELARLAKLYPTWYAKHGRGTA